MKTCLDCIPCFFKQLLEGARIAGASPDIQKKVLDEFALMLPGIPLDASPPEVARMGYCILNKTGFNGDPYKELKRKSNRCALDLLEKLKNKVDGSRDRLLAAVELAIAGNIIDFGARNNPDIEGELENILLMESESIKKKSMFHYNEFKVELKAADNILYLADNAGEVVFDRILIEEIKKAYPKKNIIYAVKEKPIINDALTEDAKFCGIDKSARIISSGSDAPGAALGRCSEKFKGIFSRADMVISKGQGNFECLSGVKRPVFFLFMVKCPAVAKETGCEMGGIVLLYKGKI